MNKEEINTLFTESQSQSLSELGRFGYSVKKVERETKAKATLAFCRALCPTIRCNAKKSGCEEFVKFKNWLEWTQKN